MCKTILFSPVGGHDPIATEHDGAMLHICRHYQPDRVVLYLSREKVALRALDDRYCAALHLLEQHTGHNFESIEQIERPDLVDVQLFDSFYREFEEILARLHRETPDAMLLLNVSSGTPAMKSALNVIAILSPWPMKAIQVATPIRRENRRKEDERDFDLELYWGTNEDNLPGSENRCKEVQNPHLMAKIKKESIRRLLDAYNYPAALMLAQEIQAFLPPETLPMLQAAACRVQLDQSGYTKALRGLPDFMPMLPGNQRKVFEYVLSLELRLKQQNYVDFLRGLTPVVVDLLELCLKHELDIAPEDFCIKVKKHRDQHKNRDDEYQYKMSTDRMGQTEKGKSILACLQASGNVYRIDGEFYNSWHLVSILKGLSANEPLKEDAQKMREVETLVRNVAAHEIVSVTDSWIREKTGLTCAEIMALLKRIMHHAGFNNKPEYWNSYEAMNQVIAATLTEADEPM